MNNYFLLIISIVIAALQNSINNLCGKQYLKNMKDVLCFQSIVFLTAFLLIALTGENSGKISFFTVCVGILFGGITAGTYLFTLLAVSNGPMSLTALIISLSMIIPALSGALIWQEVIKINHWIGLTLMLLTFAFCQKKEDTVADLKEHKSTKKWFLYCMIAFVCSGLVGVLQKIHQSSIHKGELDVFLIIAFAVAAMTFILLSKLIKIENRDKRDKIPVFRGWLFWSGIVGVCIALCNRINLFLSGELNSAVFYPIVNGGNIILTGIISVFLFKENLGKKQIFGFCLGLVAVVLIGIG